MWWLLPLTTTDDPVGIILSPLDNALVWIGCVLAVYAFLLLGHLLMGDLD